MATRLVKLIDTGELVPKTTPGIYLAPNKKYYSSEDVWLAEDLDKTIRNKCIDKMFDYMGYSSGQKLSTFFFGKLKDWRQGYKYAVILRAMELAKESIEYATRTKTFDNENAKVMYLSAIIQNNLNDALKKEEFEKTQRRRTKNITEHYEDISIPSNVKKRTNVSDLAGEHDG